MHACLLCGIFLELLHRVLIILFEVLARLHNIYAIIFTGQRELEDEAKNTEAVYAQPIDCIIAGSIADSNGAIAGLNGYNFSQNGVISVPGVHARSCSGVMISSGEHNQMNFSLAVSEGDQTPQCYEVPGVSQGRSLEVSAMYSEVDPTWINESQEPQDYVMPVASNRSSARSSLSPRMSSQSVSSQPYEVPLHPLSNHLSVQVRMCECLCWIDVIIVVVD